MWRVDGKIKRMRVSHRKIDQIVFKKDIGYVFECDFRCEIQMVYNIIKECSRRTFHEGMINLYTAITMKNIYI